MSSRPARVVVDFMAGECPDSRSVIGRAPAIFTFQDTLTRVPIRETRVPDGDMIKLGLRAVSRDSALRTVVDELLSLLVELMSAYRDAGDLELVDTLESHRRELVEAPTMRRWRRWRNRAWKRPARPWHEPAIASPSSMRS